MIAEARFGRGAANRLSVGFVSPEAIREEVGRAIVYDWREDDVDTEGLAEGESDVSHGLLNC